jgi:hypothetical protein
MRRITRALAVASIVLLGATSQAAETNPNRPPLGTVEPAVPLEPAAPEEEPPVAVEPTATAMFGRATLRVGAQKEGEGRSVKLAYDLEAETFALEMGIVFTGHLAPKGKSGRKFTLFLDEDSHETFAALIAKLGNALTNRSPESITGDVTTLVMKLDENGLPSIKIKSQVLTSGIGPVVFKLNAAHDAVPR